MNLRGFGDLIGFQQREKSFSNLLTLLYKEIFTLAEKYMNTILKSESNLSKYNFLLKLYDKAEIIKSK